MKAKNILMTLLLVTGAIAAKAAGYPPELALVSQPVMVYNANSITVYYDVENIGDYTYRGSVYLYLSPDEGYHYAREWVKVRPGRIKRIAIEIPAYRIRRSHAFTIMPYYEMHNELYSFTTFEYFEPITFYWAGPRNERWVVIHVGPCLRHYHRPGTYRYYYDGFRPPMHHGPGTPPPPMDPMHHTYGYHKEHNWYPADHNGEAPKPNEHVDATVRPDEHAGSMSGGSTSSGSTSGKPSSTSGSVSGSTSRPTSANGSVSGSTSRPSGTSTSSSGSISRPASNGSTSRPASTSGSVSGGTTRPSGTSNSSSGSVGRPASNGSTSRPASTSGSVSGSTTRPSGTSNSSSGSVSRPSSSSTSSSGRSGSSSGTRSTGTSTRGSSTGSGSGAGRR